MRLIDADTLIEEVEEIQPWEPYPSKYAEGVRHCMEVTIAIINGQPTIEPERLTDDDFETIRIHLSAFKEKLCNQGRHGEAEEYQRLIDRFMAFASAYSDVPDINVVDTISRQAAIDAVNNAFDRETVLTRFVRSIAVRAIRDMPSAQQDTDEVVSQIKWERDVAVQQLKDLGYGLGEKMEVIKDD